jgi:hypothetical protein
MMAPLQPPYRPRAWNIHTGGALRGLVSQELRRAVQELHEERSETLGARWEVEVHGLHPPCGTMTTLLATVGPIERFMVEDHARIDRLLEVATGVDPIDELAYARFRHDLLRHIAMEEKVLLPLVRAKRGGEPLPTSLPLRADHGEIAKLLVRSPTRSIVDALRVVLARHNPLEEGPEGLYAICDAFAGDEAELVVARLREVPRVPLAKYYDGPAHRRA